MHDARSFRLRLSALSSIHVILEFTSSKLTIMKYAYSILAMLLFTAVGQAQLPRTISFQGVLTDQSGTVVADGSHQLKLTMYDALNGGNPLYAETQTLTVVKGIFNAMIGSVLPIPASLAFDRPYFLGIAVDNGAELTPRTALSTVPYAFRASMADAAESLGPNATGVVTRVNGQSGDITLEGAGSTTVTKNGNTIRISSTGGGGTGIAGVQNTDGAISIQNPNGPIATLGLADGAVTGPKIAPGAVDATKITGAGAMGGQMLTWNGANVVWSNPTSGGVSSLNGSMGALALNGGGAVNVSTNGTLITVSASALQSVNSAQSSIHVTNPSGPAVDLDIENQGVKGSMIAAKAIDSSHVNPGNAPDGYVLSTRGGNATWAPPLALPFSGSLSSNQPGIAVYQSGSGTCFTGFNSGVSGEAAYFEVSNQNSSSSAIRAYTHGQRFAAEFENLTTNPNVTGTALFCRTTGNGHAGQFEINETGSTGNTLFARTSGLGNAGVFINDNAANTYAALAVTTSGKGPVLVLNQTGSSGDLAVLAVASTNKARIDRTGKGFFNGGTQNSGADVAEAIDAEGAREAYAPGDVLVISTRSDRMVEKSGEAYSTLVAGVYATKPGVLLTEESIDADLSATVPMGVIGIIPTRVCIENGPIHRGDLLVTSSASGCAMKADPARIVPGCVLGKAMQEFEGPASGAIRVLVSVK